jgi:hypothetical protein
VLKTASTVHAQLTHTSPFSVDTHTRLWQSLFCQHQYIYTMRYSLITPLLTAKLIAEWKWLVGWLVNDVLMVVSLSTVLSNLWM